MVQPIRIDLMNKKLHAPLLYAILSASMLTGCVSQEEMRSFDLRLRSMDSRLVELEKDVETINKGTGRSVKKMQKQQASLGNTIDQLNSELLQVKGKLDESRHLHRGLQAENVRLKDELASRLESIEQENSQLANKIKNVDSDISTLGQGLDAVREARGKEAAALAARKAEDAARAAEVARQKAEEAARQNEPRIITPLKSKKTTGVAAEKTAAKASKSRPDKEKKYNQAMELLQNEQYQEARQAFTSFISKNPQHPLAISARFKVGDCLYGQKEYALAILEYQNVIADYPRHDKAPSALLKQAMAFEKLHDPQTAEIVYNKIIADYPKSREAGIALDKIKGN